MVEVKGFLFVYIIPVFDKKIVNVGKCTSEEYIDDSVAWKLL